MLRKLLDEAGVGDVICLPPGVHRASVALRRSVTLVGAGDVALEGDGDSVLVVVGAPRIVLRGLVLRRGAAWAGGGLYVAGSADITLEDCVLEDNAAPGYGGGACYLADGRLRMRRCRLTGNRGRAGGAVLVEGPATVWATGCLFEGNEAATGSAICALDGAQVELLHSTLTSASAGSLVLGRGTTTRAPTLGLSSCILDGSSPLEIGDGLHPDIRLEDCLLRQPLSPEVAHRVACRAALSGEPGYIGDAPWRGLASGSPGCRGVTSAGAEGVCDLYGRVPQPGDDLGAVAQPLGQRPVGE